MNGNFLLTDQNCQLKLELRRSQVLSAGPWKSWIGRLGGKGGGDGGEGEREDTELLPVTTCVAWGLHELGGRQHDV